MPGKANQRATKMTTTVILGAVVTILVIVASIYFVSRYNTTTPREETSAQNTLREENVKVGDNSGVMRVINDLPEGKHIDKIELTTDKEPYGITLHGTDELTSQEIETISAQLLKRVDNCEWVEINSSQFHTKTTHDGVKEFSVIN